ncbi:GNAT family N-acetyltransferase [Spirosoma panaciterrae]|uniref:GNAT family N-acetyltransferase n=1 Tax=Spirosoma panaciterrae TaxID=496058 RepID=UPI000368FF54|nr:N-acetyltransferase [Spirosoma panaciterrae]
MHLFHKADADDVALLSFLAKETYTQAFAHTWSDEELFANYIDQSFSLTAITNQMADPNTEFYIVQSANELVGYFKFTITHSALFLSKMYFLQKVVGQRLGTQCMSFIDSIRQKRNLNEIILEVLASNEKGIRFYQKHGFQEVGQKENPTEKARGNLLIMKKCPVV